MSLLEKKTLSFFKQFDKFQIEVNNDKNAATKQMKLSDTANKKEFVNINKALEALKRLVGEKSKSKGQR